jgi:hypothetical protein
MVQVGSALLETTTGGKNSIRVKFTKAAAAKLRKTKSLSVTVRLVARNIAGQQVVVTTPVKLH